MKHVGGGMQIGASSGEDSRTESLPDTDDLGPLQGTQTLGLDTSFAVIHDEPFITIVYENGQFRGQVVDACLDRLALAREVAARYNLVVDNIRCDYHNGFSLHLREREVYDPD